MTKAQRAAKAKRSGAKRRKANAAAVFLRKMNPGRKLPAAVRVKRLKGGGISVTPIKMNISKKQRETLELRKKYQDIVRKMDQKKLRELAESFKKPSRYF